MQCVWSALPGMLGSQAHDKMACLKPHPSPIADPNLAKWNHHQQQHQHQQFKRKRTDSFEPAPHKRQKPADAAPKAPAKPHQTLLKFATPSTTATKATVVPSVIQPPQAAAVATKSDITPPEPAPVPEVKPAPSLEVEGAPRNQAHERIEANLNLQILLKHDELRLIEQELGKCQIALEQLRRCNVIPFPGQPGSPASADNITSGTGPALHPQPGLSRPSHPAPFGVTDGPYSRHYAQWLIPDPTFDPSLPRPPRISTSVYSMQGRSMRGSYDLPSSATTPRSGRASLSNQHASLPSNFSMPRDRHAPLTVPRPSDGQLVKIVCKVCGKKDSANVQGFTNHCRIAHGINYASHSEAIIDCGQPVGSDEAPAYVAPSQAPIEPRLASSVSVTPQNTGKPLVHPLITAPTGEQDSKRSIFGNAAAPTATRPNAPANSNAADQTAKMGLESEFVASTDNPHLSALLKKRGFNGDLKALITTSKLKIDLNEVSPLLSDEDDDSQATNCQNSTASTPNRVAVKPKNRRPNVALSGVRIPGRSQGGPSRLQINTSSAVGTGVEPRTADSSQPSTATTPSVAVSNRQVVPSSFSSDATNATSFSGPNRNFSPGGMRMSFDVASSTVASPMDIDRSEILDTLEENSEGSTSSTNLSPHTIDTNPGLVTDNEDDIDYVDSEQDEEHESQNRQVDVGVTVRDDDGHHTDEMMHHLEHAPEAKSKDLPSLPNTVVGRRSSIASTGIDTPRKRGRPRKNP